MKPFYVVLLSLLLPANFLFAQADKGQESLRGLSSVFVVVPAINEDASHDGLSAAHIRSVVESSLSQAGISVAKEPQQKDGFANLVVTIDTIKHPQGVYLFTASVALVQTVQLTRNPKLKALPSQTWGAVALGLTTPQRLDIIDEPLKEKLGEFVKAFKAANGH